MAAIFGLGSPVYGPDQGIVAIVPVTDGKRVELLTTKVGRAGKWEDIADTAFRSRLAHALEQHPEGFEDPVEMLERLFYNLPLSNWHSATYPTWDEAYAAAEAAVARFDAEQDAPPSGADEVNPLGLSARGAMHPAPFTEPIEDGEVDPETPWLGAVDPSERHVFEPLSIVNPWDCAYCFASEGALIHTNSMREQVIANYGDPSDELAAYDAHFAEFDEPSTEYLQAQRQREESRAPETPAEAVEWREVVLPGGRKYLTVVLASHLAHALRDRLTRTLGLDPYYVQWSPGGPGLQVEVVSDRYLAPGDQITAFGEARMRELGFAEPSSDDPNWTMWLADEYQAMTVAEPLVTALLDIYRLPMPEVIVAVGPLPAPVLAPTAPLAPITEVTDSATPASEQAPDLRKQDEAGARSWDVAFVIGERDPVRRTRTGRVLAVVATRIFEDAEVLPLVEAFPRTVEFASLLGLGTVQEIERDQAVYERARQRFNADIAQQIRAVSREWKPRPTDNRFEAFEMLASRLGFPSQLVVSVMPTQIQFDAFVANEKHRVGLAASGNWTTPGQGIDSPDRAPELAVVGWPLDVVYLVGERDDQSPTRVKNAWASLAVRYFEDPTEAPLVQWLPFGVSIDAPDPETSLSIADSDVPSIERHRLKLSQALSADIRDERLGRGDRYPLTWPPIRRILARHLTPALDIAIGDGGMADFDDWVPEQLSAWERRLQAAARSDWVSIVELAPGSDGYGHGPWKLTVYLASRMGGSLTIERESGGDISVTRGRNGRVIRVELSGDQPFAAAADEYAIDPAAFGSETLWPAMHHRHLGAEQGWVWFHAGRHAPFPFANPKNVPARLSTGPRSSEGSAEQATSHQAVPSTAPILMKPDQQESREDFKLRVAAALGVKPSQTLREPKQRTAEHPVDDRERSEVAVEPATARIEVSDWREAAFDTAFQVWDMARRPKKPAAVVAVSFSSGRKSQPRVEVLPECSPGGYTYLFGKGAMAIGRDLTHESESRRRIVGLDIANRLREWRMSAPDQPGHPGYGRSFDYLLADPTAFTVTELDLAINYDEFVARRSPYIPTVMAWREMVAAWRAPRKP